MANPFQWIHIIGFYKTGKEYDPPVFSSIIWDLLLLLVFIFFKGRLRAFALNNQSADTTLLNEAKTRLPPEQEEKQESVVADPHMPVKESLWFSRMRRSLIHKAADPNQLRFRRYPTWVLVDASSKD